METAVARCLELCRGPRTSHTFITADAAHLWVVWDLRDRVNGTAASADADLTARLIGCVVTARVRRLEDACSK